MADQVRWYLECKNKATNTNKFYEVKLEKELGDKYSTDRYSIKVQHGRIGKKPRPFTPNKGLAYSAARNQALSLVESKIAKGYKEVKKPVSSDPGTTETPTPQPEGRFGRIMFED